MRFLINRTTKANPFREYKEVEILADNKSLFVAFNQVLEMPNITTVEVVDKEMFELIIL